MCHESGAAELSDAKTVGALTPASVRSNVRLCIYHTSANERRHLAIFRALSAGPRRFVNIVETIAIPYPELVHPLRSLCCR